MDPAATKSLPDEPPGHARERRRIAEFVAAQEARLDRELEGFWALAAERLERNRASPCPGGAATDGRRRPTPRRAPPLRASSRPKYRSPDKPSQAWNGRSRQPVWAQKHRAILSDDETVVAKINGEDLQ